MASTLDRVKKVVAKVLKVDEAKIKPEDEFRKDLGAESIHSYELVASFEEEFDIEMDEDEALEVTGVGKAVTYIDKVLAAQKK
jgi:acyl carrier protein